MFFQDQMYIFGYKTTVFIQNLYILVKLFGKNVIFRVKSTIFFLFSGPNVHLWVQNYTFYPKFVHFSEFLGKNFIFRVKSTNFLVFRDQMYIFGYKTTVFILNLYILVKVFIKNLIFSAKSTILLFFQDQMYIFGYKTTVFTKYLYILVIFFGKNLIFSVKSTILLFFRDQMYICGYKTTVFIQKFVHFSEIVLQKSKICTFYWNILAKTNFFGGGPNVHFWVQNYSFYPKFVHFS